MDIVDLWAKAAESLNIRLNRPAAVDLPYQLSQGLIMHIPDFGAPSGTLVYGAAPGLNETSQSSESPDWGELLEIAKERGFYVSTFPPSSSYWNGPASKEDLKEALTDWGWYGTGPSKPEWLDQDWTY